MDAKKKKSNNIIGKIKYVLEAITSLFNALKYAQTTIIIDS